MEGSDPKTGTSLEISAWQEKQHAYAETYVATLPGRFVLERQLKAMLETKVSVPVRRGQRSFFLARAPGQDRSVLMLEDRTSRGDAGGTRTTRRVLVDPAQWSQRTDAIGPWSVSRDGRFVVYGLALNGADVSTVRVLNVESGKDSAIDVLPRVVWEAPQWSPDGRLLYYNTLPDLPLSDPVAMAAGCDGPSRNRQACIERLGAQQTLSRWGKAAVWTGKPRWQAFLLNGGHHRECRHVCLLEAP